MDREPQFPELTRGELAPSFELCDRSGTAVTRSQYRDKRILVLCFGPTQPFDELISGLRAQQDRLDWLETQVLMILPLPIDELPETPGKLRLLADPDLTTTRKYTAVAALGPVPAVVVLDRYGAFEQRWVAPQLPEAEELLELVEIVAMRCSP